MEIVRDRKKRTLKIKQSKYIENMCERFGLTEAKPVHTPMDPKFVLRKAIHMSELHPDNELYRAIIGSLMYAAQLCRPDILYAVCRLSRYLNEPTMTHMTQAKRCLVYSYTHQHQGITYGKKIHGIIGHNIIYGYADADFAFTQQLVLVGGACKKMAILGKKLDRPNGTLGCPIDELG